MIHFQARAANNRQAFVSVCESTIDHDKKREAYLFNGRVRRRLNRFSNQHGEHRTRCWFTKLIVPAEGETRTAKQAVIFRPICRSA